MEQVSARAVAAIGFLCYGDRSIGLLEVATAALLGMTSEKSEEVQLAIGVALCFAFGGA